MNEKKLHYPLVVSWFLTYLSSISFFTGVLKGRDIWDILAWSGVISFFVGIPLGMVITDFLYGYQLNRTVKTHNYQYPFEVRAVIENKNTGELQSDNFKGLSPDQWTKVAKNVLTARNFTYATVGQTERPILVPMFLASDYIISVGSGKYEPTDKLYKFCERILTTPPQSLAFRNLLKFTL